jgi:hypothetical protein
MNKTKLLVSVFIAALLFFTLSSCSESPMQRCRTFVLTNFVEVNNFGDANSLVTLEEQLKADGSSIDKELNKLCSEKISQGHFKKEYK